MTISCREFELLIQVGLVARKLFESEYLDAEALREAARVVLCEAYGVIDPKRLDPHAVEFDWRNSILRQWWVRSMPSATVFPELWITEMLRGRRSERNPLRWAYAIAYFVERHWTSIDAFFLNALKVAGRQLPLWADMECIPLEIQRAFESATTMAQAAKALGVTPPTVRKWMQSNPGLVAISQQWKLVR